MVEATHMTHVFLEREWPEPEAELTASVDVKDAVEANDAVDAQDEEDADASVGRA